MKHLLQFLGFGSKVYFKRRIIILLILIFLVTAAIATTSISLLSRKNISSQPQAATQVQTNVALNKPVIVHINDVNWGTDNDWDKMVDGSLSTRWLVEAKGAIGVVDLQSLYQVNSIRYKLSYDGRYGNWSIIQLAGSTDNANWIILDERQIDNSGAMVTVPITPGSYRYIKLFWKDLENTKVTWEPPWGDIFELEVYEPQPPPTANFRTYCVPEQTYGNLKYGLQIYNISPGTIISTDFMLSFTAEPNAGAIRNFLGTPTIDETFDTFAYLIHICQPSDPNCTVDLANRSVYFEWRRNTALIGGNRRTIDDLAAWAKANLPSDYRFELMASLYVDNRWVLAGYQRIAIFPEACVPPPTPTRTPTPAPSCTVSSINLIPASATPSLGQTTSFTATFTANPSGCVNEVRFARYDGTYITNPSPASDISAPYTTSVTCSAAGTGAGVSAQPYAGGLSLGGKTSTVNCISGPTPTRTPTPIPVPPAPSGLSASCPAPPGTTAAVSWNAVAGATSYALRVDDLINGWTATCAPVNPGDTCISIASRSYNVSTTAGRSYRWWVHACNGSGCSASSGGPNFNCILPTPTPTRTPTPAAPTPTRTRTPTPRVDDRPYSSNLLKNWNFEVDVDRDGLPDYWTKDTRYRRFTRFSSVRRGGLYSGRHLTKDNTNISYIILQTVSPVVAAKSYEFSGYVYIPPTSDSFSFKLQVSWLNGINGAVVRTNTVKTYTAPTGGWNYFVGRMVSPVGAVSAQVRMNVSGLNPNATVYVDDFNFVQY